MSKQQHTKALKTMRKAEQFPTNTCAASRHTAMIAEALIRGKTHHALTDEPDNCGDSMAATVEALWVARSVKADLLAALKGLLEDIEDYQRINHLGGENNHSQVIARAAIKRAEEGK